MKENEHLNRTKFFLMVTLLCCYNKNEAQYADLEEYYGVHKYNHNNPFYKVILIFSDPGHSTRIKELVL